MISLAFVFCFSTPIIWISIHNMIISVPFWGTVIGTSPVTVHFTIRLCLQCCSLRAQLHIQYYSPCHLLSAPQWAVTVFLQRRLIFRPHRQPLIPSPLSCCWWHSMVVEVCSESCVAPSLWCRVSLGHDSVGVPECPCFPRILAPLGWRQCWRCRTVTESCGSWDFCICVHSALLTAVWVGCKDYWAPAPCPQLPWEDCPWLSSRLLAAGCCRSCH